MDAPQHQHDRVPTARAAPGERGAARLLAASLVSVFLVFAGSARAENGSGTGLPLPRFVSLRADEANIRTGPGVRYPVEWVYVRRFMPLEITAEFGNWRKIRDWEGTEGWVHKSMLSGRRTVIVTGKVSTIRRSPSAAGTAVAYAEAGVIGTLLECRPGWCRIDIQGYRGWLQRDQFWGVFPKEFIK